MFTRLLSVTLIGLLSSTLVHASSATIVVTHEYEGARNAETIAIAFEQLAAVLPDARMYHLVVRDANGRELASQVTNYEHDHRGARYDDLVFSYDFAPGQKRATFTVDSTASSTPPQAPCTYARQVPERHDDIAWENDRIAHRMYGAKLNTPAAGAERLRGSGIDTWAKRVSYPIVDRWYTKGHDQFHKDEEGEGLDLYSIGGTRGAGGTGIWDGRTLWTSDNYASARVLSNGPRRAAFTLTYAPWDAGTLGKVSETKRFTVDCGSNFDRVESTFEFEADEAVVGIGITAHATAAGFPAPVLTKDPQGRWMSLWEENSAGGLGVAIVLSQDATPAGFATEQGKSSKDSGNHLLLVKTRAAAPVHYFTGAGWSRSGQFKNRDEWERYVKNFQERVQKPITVHVSASE